jgi:hypothetical protein
VRARVDLSEVLAARRPLLRARRHPVVVVAQFVEEDVQQLVRAEGLLGKVQDVALTRRLDRHAEAVEDVAVALDVLGGDQLREAPRLRANRHQARAMEAVTVRPCRRQQGRVQPDRQRRPFRQDRKELTDVSDEQDVAVAGAGVLAIDLRKRARRAVVRRRRS